MIPATWQARQQQPSRTTTAHVRSVFASNGEIDSQGIDKAIINAVMAAAEKEQAQSQPQSKGDGKAKDDDGPSGPRDFYSVNAADEELAEAQERYAQARARRERFLMEAQANFRQMAEKADEELQAFVDQEEAMAQALELRVKEVKEVKEEVSALVKEADELMGGGKKIMALFDVVSTLSFLVVLDTFYVSYLAYRGSELLTTSLATEVILGGSLFFKVKWTEKDVIFRENEGKHGAEFRCRGCASHNIGTQGGKTQSPSHSSPLHLPLPRPHTLMNICRSSNGRRPY